MREQQIVEYLAQKTRFGDMATDMRWEAFSPVYLRECKKANLIADCGAEFGFYIHLARHANPDCRVVAFEPEPPRFDALHAFFNDVEGVKIYHHAVSNSCESIRIYKTAGRSASMDENLSQWGVVNKEAIDVPATTLDTFFGDDVPDIIKMDIEGAEVFAFDGMRSLFQSGKPILFLEFHRQFIESMDPTGEARMLAILQDCGYEIYNAYGEPADFLSSRIILATPERAQNIAFEKREEIRVFNRNLDFSIRFSRLYESIERIAQAGYRLVIYGDGSIGRTLRKLIPDEMVVATVDAASTVRDFDSSSAGSELVYAPEILPRIAFDFVLITVLGREEVIESLLINDLGISRDKLLTFRIGEDPTLKFNEL